MFNFYDSFSKVTIIITKMYKTFYSNRVGTSPRTQSVKCVTVANHSLTLERLVYYENESQEARQTKSDSWLQNVIPHCSRDCNELFYGANQL